MIGALICWWKRKHLRGKPIKELEWHKGRRFFECPRCGRITSYKTTEAGHAERTANPVD